MELGELAFQRSWGRWGMTGPAWLVKELFASTLIASYHMRGLANQDHPATPGSTA